MGVHSIVVALASPSTVICGEWWVGLGAFRGWRHQLLSVKTLKVEFVTLEVRRRHKANGVCERDSRRGTEAGNGERTRDEGPV